MLNRTWSSHPKLILLQASPRILSMNLSHRAFELAPSMTVTRTRSLNCAPELCVTAVLRSHAATRHSAVVRSRWESELIVSPRNTKNFFVEGSRVSMLTPDLACKILAGDATTCVLLLVGATMNAKACPEPAGVDDSVTAPPPKELSKRSRTPTNIGVSSAISMSRYCTRSSEAVAKHCSMRERRSLSRDSTNSAQIR